MLDDTVRSLSLSSLTSGVKYTMLSRAINLVRLRLRCRIRHEGLPKLSELVKGH